MAVDLADYAPALRRQITPLGSTLYTGVEDEALVPYLTDSFWEVRLDGFLVGYQVDEDGLITPISGDEDLALQYVSLIVLYAGIKILRNQILNTKTGLRAKAGPVEYEEEYSATVLAEMLKQMRATKEQILEELDTAATATLYLDAYSTRLLSSPSYWGSPELMG